MKSVLTLASVEYSMQKEGPQIQKHEGNPGRPSLKMHQEQSTKRQYMFLLCSFIGSYTVASSGCYTSMSFQAECLRLRHKQAEGSLYHQSGK